VVAQNYFCRTVPTRIPFTKYHPIAPNALFLPCYLLFENLSNTTLVFKSLVLHCIQHVTHSLSVWNWNVICIHAYMSMIVIRIEYWLLDCLDWIDCEEEQGYYCDCCECASCYQGKWHTYSLPNLLCISIFTSCSMHDRCFYSTVLSTA
jgi:hypothetical protein